MFKKIIDKAFITEYLIALYVILGFIGNYLFHIFQNDSGKVLLINYFSLFIIFIGIIALFFGLQKKHYKITDYGFIINKRLWISIIIICIGTIFLIKDYNLYGEVLTVKLFLSVILVMIEEIIFRAILFNKLMNILINNKYKVILSIILSSLIFTLPHIPIKNFAELMGVFTSSVAFTYIYYLSRSIVLPIYFHVISNTITSFGLLGGFISLIIYFILSIFLRENHTSFNLYRYIHDCWSYLSK